MKTNLATLVLLGLLLAAGALFGQATADAPGDRASGADVSLPAHELEAMGTCATPRQAWLQLLYWLQPERWDLEKATACIDHAGRTKEEVGELAVRLKRVLDARGVFVPVDELPLEAGFLNASGHARHGFEHPAVGVLDVVRSGDRWLLSSRALDRVPALYAQVVPGWLARALDSLGPWAQHRFLGLPVWQYVGLFVLLLVGFIVQRLCVFLIGYKTRKLAGRVEQRYLERGLHRIDRPVGGLAMAGVLTFGIPMLQLPLRLTVLALLATRVLAAFSAVWLFYRLIDVLADWLSSKAAKTDTKLDDQLVPLLRKTFKVFTTVVGGIFILQNLDVDVGSLLAGLGLGGLAFALAAKDTVANFFGSVMIFIDKPFQIGDWVKLPDGVEGTVEEVGFRTTKVRTFYNSLVTVPNGNLVSTSIDNLGVRQYRRYSTTIGLTYDSPPEKVEAFCQAIRELIEDLDGMRKDMYIVELKDFGPSSLEIMLYCFMQTPTWQDEMRVRTELNLRIMRLVARMGLAFAFPTQTIHLARSENSSP